MTIITLPTIQTTVGVLFSKAIGEAKKIGSVVKAALTDAGKVAGEVGADVIKIEPTINAAIQVLAPQYAGAATVAEAAFNAIDAAIESAAGAAAGPVTVSLPAELVADWKAARAALVSFESVI